MLSKIISFVKEFQQEIILFFGVLLISSLSFAFGYITAKNQEKNYLEFENPIPLDLEYEENTGT